MSLSTNHKNLHDYKAAYGRAPKYFAEFILGCRHIQKRDGLATLGRPFQAPSWVGENKRGLVGIENLPSGACQSHTAHAGL